MKLLSIDGLDVRGRNAVAAGPTEVFGIPRPYVHARATGAVEKARKEVLGDL